MATTRIIPMHLNKGKTLAQCLADRTEYGMNPDKTEGGALISAFACEPETAVSEFVLSKREYRELTGRVQESDVIAYQVRQSFKPGEITPEEANRIGYEFAKRFLKGRHAFLVCTHTDKKHIHNHIYWNSTALDCTRKFKNFIGSYRAVRRLSDLICAEHRLSVVENPQKHGLSYNKWRGGHDKLSNRDLLRMAIDAALEKQPQDFDALLALLKDSGYSVARKSRLSLRHENQKQSIRLESLGEGYSEQELRAVLAGSRTHKPFVRKKYPQRRERATLIADIEAKLNSGKGYRYDQAMKVVKLKQMAKTLIYLEEKGFADFDALVNAAADAEKRFYDLKAAIKAAEARMGEIQTLRTHIMNYSRTRSVYTGYRKAGYSKKYLAEHEGDILAYSFRARRPPPATRCESASQSRKANGQSFRTPTKLSLSAGTLTAYRRRSRWIPAAAPATAPCSFSAGWCSAASAAQAWYAKPFPPAIKSMSTTSAPPTSRINPVRPTGCATRRWNNWFWTR